MQKKLDYILVFFLIALGATARLFPHPANVAPIGAIALFAGLYLPRRLSLIVPLFAMFLSDLVIGFYSLPIMTAVYGSFLVSIAIARIMKRKKTIPFLIGGTTLGAIVFFLLTNAAVWAFGTMYSHSLSGLAHSYSRAIPFFRNSLVGDLFFVGLLIGGYELLAKLHRRRFVHLFERT